MTDKVKISSDSFWNSISEQSDKNQLYLAIKQLAKEMAEADKVTFPKTEEVMKEEEPQSGATPVDEVTGNAVSEREKEDVNIMKQPEKKNRVTPEINAIRDIQQEDIIVSKLPKKKKEQEPEPEPEQEPEANNEAILNENENSIEPQGEKLVIKKGSSNDRYYYYTPTESLYVNSKSFYEREIDAYRKLQNRLELQRNKKATEEVKALKPKPSISTESEKIIKNKFKDEKPIYMRAQEIIDKKQAKLQATRHQYYENLDNEFKCKKSSTNQPYDQNKINQFVNDQMNWKKQKEIKINEAKRELERLENEACQGLYKPTIEKTSEEIVKTKQTKGRQQPSYERLYQNHEENMLKRQMLQMKNLPSFSPVINKTQPKYCCPNQQDKSQSIDPGTLEGPIDLDKFQSQRGEDYSNPDIDLEDEDPLISQYRLHLERTHLTNSAVKSLIQQNVKMQLGVAKNKDNVREKDQIESSVNRPEPQLEPRRFVQSHQPQPQFHLQSQYQAKAQSDPKLDPEPDLSDEIAKLRNFFPEEDQENALFKQIYKLNVRNNTSTGAQKEDKVIATPKFTNMIKKHLNC